MGHRTGVESKERIARGERTAFSCVDRLVAERPFPAVEEGREPRIRPVCAGSFSQALIALLGLPGDGLPRASTPSGPGRCGSPPRCGRAPVVIESLQGQEQKLTSFIEVLADEITRNDAPEGRIPGRRACSGLRSGCGGRCRPTRSRRSSDLVGIRDVVRSGGFPTARAFQNSTLPPTASCFFGSSLPKTWLTRDPTVNAS